MILDYFVVIVPISLHGTQSPWKQNTLSLFPLHHKGHLQVLTKLILFFCPENTYLTFEILSRSLSTRPFYIPASTSSVSHTTSYVNAPRVAVICFYNCLSSYIQSCFQSDTIWYPFFCIFCTWTSTRHSAHSQ